MPFQIEQIPRISGEYLYLYTSLDGTLSVDTISEGVQLASQIKEILQTIHDILEPKMSSTIFASLDTLTEYAESLLMDKRDLFGSVIDTTEVRLRAKIRKLDTHTKLHRKIIGPAVAASSTETKSELSSCIERGLEDNTKTIKNIFIALGSNMGDRLQNIENACREMDAQPEIQVLRTSALYETAPMYVEDQDRFLNGVCEVGHLSLESSVRWANATRSARLCSPSISLTNCRLLKRDSDE